MTAIVTEFFERAREVARDAGQRGRIRSALRKYEVKRDEKKAAYVDWESARQAAAEAKYEAINGLADYLEIFAAQLEARGTRVHWAEDAEQARQIIVGVARDHRARSAVKSKAMTAEEIHLNEALAHAGVEVVESDLGEFIVQLRKEPPYHIVFPAMHLTRGQISELFHREIGSERVTEPEALTMIARAALRAKYLSADIGITGANFAVAETGMIAITENEGNARLTSALPPVMITLVGIEKVIPRLDDLAVLWPMLATAGAGQTMTAYNTLYSGPRAPGEADGPREWHVVLLDNRRTALLADPEQRDALHCIRCGACLNVCPVFRSAGGHTYGTTYSGPIGSVITPHLRGLQDWKHLSGASSLCGACTEACPVKIDLHHHLLRNRRNAVREKPPLLERLAFRAFAFVVNRPGLYLFAKELGRVFQPFHRWIARSRLDPARPWTESRELPELANQSFKEWWRARQ